MKFGFLIDHRKCIGCHACTVACKSENEVPIGTYRTWVKYIEKGDYPDTRRFFSVLRCNHCQDAPCVTICPTTALFKRDNGVVDFDNQRCIGCKSCMQACPYDALYINPYTNTAEKCNFCAPRVETGMQPACEVVCPTQAILSGDLDDSTSLISQMLSSNKTSVRKPEAQTKPKLYYINVNRSSIVPTEQTHTGGYLWAEPQLHAAMADEQALAAAEAKARTTYDVAHERPWGWKVSAYLWTKSVAAGAFLLGALAMGLGVTRNHWLFTQTAPVVSLVFLVATLALLVWDLKRPERFFYIMLKPQWKSWLVIGGYILAGYGAILTAWLALPFVNLTTLRPPLLWLGAILAALTAVYSAFLFKQARGRVFWSNALTTTIHLLVQAVIAGSAVLIIISVINAWVKWNFFFEEQVEYLTYELLGGLVAHAILVAAEIFLPEENVEKARAARFMRRGSYAKLFWGGVVGGTVLPIILLAVGIGQFDIFALLIALVALAGLFIWEHLWVQAGQAVPLS